MNGRHDRNTKVDVASFVADAKAAVLRHAALGNVQLGHHLDARNQSLMMRQIDGVDFRVKRAVNAVLNLHFGVARFDMDVGSPRLHRVVDDRVHQLDDRRHFTVSRQAIEIEDFFPLLCFPNQRQSKSRCRLLQDPLGRVTFAQDDIDCTRSRHVRDDARL